MRRSERLKTKEEALLNQFLSILGNGNESDIDELDLDGDPGRLRIFRIIILVYILLFLIV